MPGKRKTKTDTPEDRAEHFAENVGRLAGMHGLRSHGDIADALDIPTSTISKWMSGGRLPSFDSLLAVSKAFGISADLLVGPFDGMLDQVLDRERFNDVETRIWSRIHPRPRLVKGDS